MSEFDSWRRFQEFLCVCDPIGLRLDISRMEFPDSLFADMSGAMNQAFAAMDALEDGAPANRDEGRMVGHYWLRDSQLAPGEIGSEIAAAIESVRQFAKDVHDGALSPQKADGFYVVLVIGIGGSALGAQFVCDALGRADDPMIVRFLDNTDPDGIDRVLGELGEDIDKTLTVVVSKSGTTVETRNGMVEAAAAYRRAGLDFRRHAVAVTCEGSALHETAMREGWIKTFPMWEWVGGRTSVLSPAGLVPAALQGCDVAELLDGARRCDRITRAKDIRTNPAALLALIIHHATNGRGDRNLVVLPYKDRLGLLGRYLQQLVMESLGKERDRDGNVVHQGLTVYGNKGSTDQHALVQQLRDGRDDFVVLFLSVLRDRQGPSVHVEKDLTAGDYLHGFLYGTRDALTRQGRPSITLTLDELTPSAVGVLIALFERTVGLYAELIHVNAYDQPGVEAGKQAARKLMELQRSILAHLRSHRGREETAREIALALEEENAESVYHVLEHVAANVDHGVERTGPWSGEARFRSAGKA